MALTITLDTKVA